MSAEERRAFFKAKHEQWLASLTPEQLAAATVHRQEMEKVRQLTPEEQRAYFEQRRKERGR
jgi:hypothetical protein